MHPPVYLSFLFFPIIQKRLNICHAMRDVFHRWGLHFVDLGYFLGISIFLFLAFLATFPSMGLNGRWSGDNKKKSAGKQKQPQEFQVRLKKPPTPLYSL